MPSHLRSKLGSHMGNIGIMRPLAFFARPKRTLFLLVALTVVYCIVVSWSNAKYVASLLRGADIVKDGHGIGVIFRLSGVEIQTIDEPAFDEAQLPFDDANVNSRKTAAKVREEFDKEYKEAGR